MSKNYIRHTNASLPRIEGAKGGGKGGSGRPPSEAAQSLFGTDIIFTTIGLSEGPVYRINSNGPQDIEIADSSIDDLVLLDGDGGEDTSKFKTLSTTGTNTQDRLDVFGENIITPQNFASPVSLKKGNLAGVPSSGITLQETSAQSWDALKFIFQINGLQKVNDNGDIKSNSLSIKIQVFPAPADGETEIVSIEKKISGKTSTPFR
jgi:predicted phage tail protein